MGKIYRNARQVVTYLGQSQPGDTGALGLMQRICKHFEQFRGRPELTFTYEAYNRYAITPGRIPEEFMFDLEPDDPDWIHLSSIIINEWLTRLWVVQENLLNSLTLLLRGSRTVPIIDAIVIYDLIMVSLLP